VTDQGVHLHVFLHSCMVCKAYVVRAIVQYHPGPWEGGLSPPPSATAETLTYPQTVTPSLTLLNLTLDLISVAPCSHAVRNRTEQKLYDAVFK